MPVQCEKLPSEQSRTLPFQQKSQEDAQHIVGAQREGAKSLIGVATGQAGQADANCGGTAVADECAPREEAVAFPVTPARRRP